MKSIILFLIGTFIAFCNGSVRIAGGEETTINDYPFAVALITNSGVGNSFQQACGGSLVTTSAILSAASCYQDEEGIDTPSAWRARVGSSFSNSGGTIYLLRAINIHPDFVVTTKLNDVAVLRTTLTVNLVPGVVELAKIAAGAYTFVETTTVNAIGWGDATDEEEPSSQLRHVRVWPTNQEVCASRYNSIGVTVPDSIVCAGWIDVGVRGQCEGDTGSPLVDDDGVIVGVFSWAQGCAEILYPALNTRVTSFNSWIVSAAFP